MRPALLFLFLFLAAFAHGNETFEVAESIINAELPCSQLTDSQLEDLGDYYMEQMHPGESHELMDEMMGGEGSESLKDMHISMAKRLYCGETSTMGSGMMGYGMMGGSSMMGGYTSTPITYYLYVALLAGLVILVFKQIFKQGGKK